ncbi:MAG: TSUP family transporter [Ruminiclostridium sp.]|nr:TSUP family transporter [Ruminiclostridium sp.]
MLLEYIIICPLVFIAGFIDAVAGGGGLVSLPAYMMTGLPVHSCVATNKMSAFMGTTVTTIKYAKSGFIPWKTALFCIPCAIGGSALGAGLSLLIPDMIFTIVMIVVVPLTGIYVLVKKDAFAPRKTHGEAATIIICVAASFVIGVYDGFYGPGTGTFLILILTGLAGMELTKANGLTKAINFSTNISALVVFLINGQVLFPLGIIAGVFNIAGNYLGAARFEKNGSKIVKPVLIIVLSVFFIKLIYEMIFQT